MLRFLFILLPFLAVVENKTVRYEVQTCDGAERKVLAARLVAGEIRGTVECRYAPQASQYSLAFNFNSLDLRRESGACPTLKIVAYTATRVMEEVDAENFPNTKRGIRVPEDPVTLLEADCNNYQSKIGKTFQTQKLGQKIQVTYDAKIIGRKSRGAFDIILTSYMNGRSYQCEEGHFRCWSVKYMCIDSSLECDYENNCSDKSDEDNFKCTGKIAGLQLPLFIIILVLILLLIIGLVVGCVLYRRKRNRKMLERRNRGPMGDPRQMQPLYTPDPNVYPPDGSIAPSSSHQYSAYGPPSHA